MTYYLLGLVVFVLTLRFADPNAFVNPSRARVVLTILTWPMALLYCCYLWLRDEI